MQAGTKHSQNTSFDGAQEVTVTLPSPVYRYFTKFRLPLRYELWAGRRGSVREYLQHVYTYTHSGDQGVTARPAPAPGTAELSTYLAGSPGSRNSSAEYNFRSTALASVTKHILIMGVCGGRGNYESAVDFQCGEEQR